MSDDTSEQCADVDAGGASHYINAVDVDGRE